MRFQNKSPTKGRPRRRDGPIRKLVSGICRRLLQTVSSDPEQPEIQKKEDQPPAEKRQLNMEEGSNEAKADAESKMPLETNPADGDTTHDQNSDQSSSIKKEEECKEDLIVQSEALEKVPPIFPEGSNVEEVKKLLKYEEMKGKTVISTDNLNIQLILENDKRFSGKMILDEFNEQTMIGTVPWNAEGNKVREITDTDTAAIMSILQRDYNISNRADLDDAILLVTNRHRFNPVIDMLEGFEWDGKDHIRTLLPKYLGATDTEYNYQVMRLAMVAAVKRVYEPGCKFDYVIVLHGGQGIGKSTFLKKLAVKEELFSDSVVNLDGDEAAKSLLGVWIVELAELKAIEQTKGGEAAVKRFITAPTDRFRLPYERRFRTYPRRFVLFGTVNPNDFLVDLTGNRRYLIVECGVTEPHTSELFSDTVMEDIEGAWAEALYIYKTENPELVLPEEFQAEAEALQVKHTAEDGSKGLVQEFLKDKDVTCALEIWEKALHQTRKMTNSDSKKISDLVLCNPEWEHCTGENYGAYGKQRVFKKRKKLQ